MLKINLDIDQHLWRIVDAETGHEERAAYVQIDTPCSLVLSPKGKGGWLEVDGHPNRDGDAVVITRRKG